MNFFVKIGHVAKVVAIDAAKVGEVAAPVAADVVPIVLPGAPGLAVEKILSLVPAHSDKLISISTGGSDVNPLEAFAVSIVLGVLQQVVKNPAHAAMMKEMLLGLATDIFTTYGIVPPAVK